MIEIRQGAGVRPLIPTKQATISFGKPDEPIQPADPEWRSCFRHVALT
jgi:hypothetical protein